MLKAIKEFFFGPHKAQVAENEAVQKVEAVNAQPIVKEVAPAPTVVPAFVPPPVVESAPATKPAATKKPRQQKQGGAPKAKAKKPAQK
jgi:hypothetical protein